MQRGWWRFRERSSTQTIFDDGLRRLALDRWWRTCSWERSAPSSLSSSIGCAVIARRQASGFPSLPSRKRRNRSCSGKSEVWRERPVTWASEPAPCPNGMVEIRERPCPIGSYRGPSGARSFRVRWFRRPPRGRCGDVAVRSSSFQLRCGKKFQRLLEHAQFLFRRDLTRTSQLLLDILPSEIEFIQRIHLSAVSGSGVPSHRGDPDHAPYFPSS